MKSLIIAIALLTFGIKVSAFDWKAQWKQSGTVFNNANRPNFVTGGGIWAPDGSME